MNETLTTEEVIGLQRQQPQPFKATMTTEEVDALTRTRRITTLDREDPAAVWGAVIRGERSFEDVFQDEETREQMRVVTESYPDPQEARERILFSMEMANLLAVPFGQTEPIANELAHDLVYNKPLYYRLKKQQAVGSEDYRPAKIDRPDPKMITAALRTIAEEGYPKPDTTVFDAERFSWEQAYRQHVLDSFRKDRNIGEKIWDAHGRNVESIRGALVVTAAKRSSKEAADRAIRNYEAMQAGYALDPIESNWLGNLLIASTAVTGSFHASAASMLKGAGAGATIGAVADAWLGPLQIFSKPVTAASGAKVGAKIGALYFWQKQGAGDFYVEMRKMGISHDTANIVSEAAAIPYAAVEMAQWATMIPGLRKAATSAAKRPLLNILYKYVESYGEEVAEEGIQRLVQEYALDVAELVEEGHIRLDAHRTRAFFEEIQGAAAAFALAPLPGMVQDTLALAGRSDPEMRKVIEALHPEVAPAGEQKTEEVKPDNTSRIQERIDEIDNRISLDPADQDEKTVLEAAQEDPELANLLENAGLIGEPPPSVSPDVKQSERQATPALQSSKGGEVAPSIEQSRKTVIFDGTLYHNTDADAADAIMQSGFKVEDTSKLSRAERGFAAGNLGDGVYLSPDYGDNMNRWGGSTNIVVKPTRPLKLYNLGDTEGSARIDIEFADKLKTEGYDGIIVNDPHKDSGGYQVVVFDAKNIKAQEVVEQSETITDEQLNTRDVRLSFPSTKSSPSSEGAASAQQAAPLEAAPQAAPVLTEQATPPSEAQPTPQAKQPWEMTREEFASLTPADIEAMPDKIVGPWWIQNEGTDRLKTKEGREQLHRVYLRHKFANEFWKLTRSVLESHTLEEPAYNAHDWAARELYNHKETVEKAVKAGKPVPLSVLQEYKGEKWADEAMAKQSPQEMLAQQKEVEEEAKSLEEQPPQGQDVDAIVNLTNDILKRFKVKAKVKAVKRVKGAKREVAAGRTEPTGAMYEQTPGKAIIELAFKEGTPELSADIETAVHESWHVLRNSLPADVRSQLDAEFGGDLEAEAAAAAKYLADEKLRKDGSVMAKAIEYIVELLKKIRNALSDAGYESAEDIFEAAWRGEFGGEFGADEGKGLAFEQRLPKVAERHLQQAKKEFGFTDDFREAGYITANGDMLDFSEKREGGNPGQRSLDHRAVSRFMPEPKDRGRYSQAMRAFQKEGNIRIDGNSGLIDMEAPLRYAQLQTLREYIQSRDGEVVVDIKGGEFNKEYDAGTRPSQIIGDINAYWGTNPAVEFEQRSNNPVWYSKLQQVTDAKMSGPMPAKDLANMLKSAGVKDEELEWSGVKDLIDKGGKISPADLRATIAQNNVQVQEVTKGDTSWQDTRADLVRERQDVDAELSEATDEGQIEELQNRLAEIDDDLEAVEEQERRTTEATKFATYQLPGGENYRELLLTLPDPAAEAGIDLNAPGSAIAARDARRASKAGDTFTSSHWDTPNVLAHIRFNERTDADDNRVLFVEEIQSDWHQQGREKGYKQPGLTQQNFKTWLEQNGAAFTGELQRQWDERKGPAYEQWAEEQERALRNAMAVPDAPFKKTWHELAFKRMLRWAAEAGFDKLAWTTGEQQAERYDLSKQVSRVLYDEGNEVLTAEDKKGVPVLQIGAKPAAIADHIGKEAAKKLMEQPYSDNYPGLMRILEGENLKVGGEGMKGFYDKILVDFANRYGKKWGARVGDARISFRIDYPEENYSERETETVHALPITEDMKASVMQGQPLYEQRKGRQLNLFGDIEEDQAAPTVQEQLELPISGEPASNVLATMPVSAKLQRWVSYQVSKRQHEQYKAKEAGRKGPENYTARELYLELLQQLTDEKGIFLSQNRLQEVKSALANTTEGLVLPMFDKEIGKIQYEQKKPVTDPQNYKSLMDVARYYLNKPNMDIRDAEAKLREIFGPRIEAFMQKIMQDALGNLNKQQRVIKKALSGVRKAIRESGVYKSIVTELQNQARGFEGTWYLSKGELTEAQHFAAGKNYLRGIFKSESERPAGHRRTWDSAMQENMTRQDTMGREYDLSEGIKADSGAEQGQWDTFLQMVDMANRPSADRRGLNPTAISTLREQGDPEINYLLDKEEWLATEDLETINKNIRDAMEFFGADEATIQEQLVSEVQETEDNPPTPEVVTQAGRALADMLAEKSKELEAKIRQLETHIDWLQQKVKERQNMAVKAIVARETKKIQKKLDQLKARTKAAQAKAKAANEARKQAEGNLVSIHERLDRLAALLDGREWDPGQVQVMVRDICKDLPFEVSEEVETELLTAVDSEQYRAAIARIRQLIPARIGEHIPGPDPVDYTQVQPQKEGLAKSISDNLTRLQDLAALAKDALVPMADRLRRTAPAVFRALRNHAFYSHKLYTQWRQAVEPFCKGIQKLKRLDRNAYARLHRAAQNGNESVFYNALDQFGLRPLWQDTQKVLHDVYYTMRGAGIDVDYIENYFPRVLADFAKFARITGSTLDDRARTAIANRERLLGRQLTQDERMKVQNALLEGQRMRGISFTPGGARERTADYVTDETADCYHEMIPALDHYLREVAERVATRQFFGKEPKNVQKWRKMRNALRTRLSRMSEADKNFLKLGAVLVTMDERMTLYDKEYLDNSVGAYVWRARENGILSAGSVEEVRQMLSSYFKPGFMNKHLRFYMNVNQIMALGSPLAAMTQIGDLGVAFATDPVGFIGAAIDVITRSTPTTLEKVGINELGREYEDIGMSWLSHKVLTMTGFRLLDRLGKETLLTTAYYKMQEQAAKQSNKELDRYLDQIFPTVGDRNRVKGELRDGLMTQDVLFTLFNKLSDCQPISLAEMPALYSRSGSGKLFYFLQTYSIRQTAWMYSQVVELWKTDRDQAMKNAMMITMGLLSANFTAQLLREIAKNAPAILAGEGPEPEELAEEAAMRSLMMLATAGVVNRYTLNMLSQGDIEEFWGSLFGVPAIPAKAATDIYRDIKNEELEKTLRYVPGGQLLYYWTKD